MSKDQTGWRVWVCPEDERAAHERPRSGVLFNETFEDYVLQSKPVGA